MGVTNVKLGLMLTPGCLRGVLFGLATYLLYTYIYIYIIYLIYISLLWVPAYLDKHGFL